MRRALPIKIARSDVAGFTVAVRAHRDGPGQETSWQRRVAQHLPPSDSTPRPGQLACGVVRRRPNGEMGHLSGGPVTHSAWKRIPSDQMSPVLIT